MTAVHHPNATPFAQVAPLEHKQRKFIICFDDMSYNPTYKTPSNIRKLLALLHNDDEDSQIVSYHVGIIFCFQCQFSYVVVAMFWT